MTTTEYVPDVTVLAELDADLDALLDVLTDSRRRFVVALLRSAGPTKTLRDLIHGIATREHDEAITGVPKGDRFRSAFRSITISSR